MEDYVTMRWLAMSSWHEAVFETYGQAQSVLDAIASSLKTIEGTDNLCAPAVHMNALNGRFLVQPQAVSIAHIFSPKNRYFWERYANFCQKKVKEIRDDISEVGFRAK